MSNQSSPDFLRHNYLARTEPERREKDLQATSALVKAERVWQPWFLEAWGER
jgi:hypothetical protein